MCGYWVSVRYLGVTFVVYFVSYAGQEDMSATSACLGRLWYTYMYMWREVER